MPRCAIALLAVACLTSPALSQQKRTELKSGEDLLADEKLTTPDGRCTLTMQGDGNLVWMLHDNGQDRVLWDSGTARLKLREPKLAMQTDGNLVIYGRGPNGTYGPQWATDTTAHRGAKLVCEIDGNLIMYHDGKPVWVTGTQALRPLAFKLQVKRTVSAALGGAAITNNASSIELCVNGKKIGKVWSGETRTFDIPEELGRQGKNDIICYDGVTGLKFSPKQFDRDDKYAYKFFAVHHPGEVVNLTVGYAGIGDNPYEISNEVTRHWVGPYTAKVAFDERLTEEVIKETPPIRLGTGDTKEYSERVRVAQRVEVTETTRLEASARAKVTTGFKTVEGGIRAEWQRVTKNTTEYETETIKKITMVGNGTAKKVRWVAYYRTGVSTVYIDGQRADVPFKIFDHFDVQTQDVR